MGVHQGCVFGYQLCLYYQLCMFFVCQLFVVSFLFLGSMGEEYKQRWEEEEEEDCDNRIAYGFYLLI